MLAVPLQIGRRRILVLVLERENLVRLQQADPIDLNTAMYFIKSFGANDVELLIAYEEDTAKLAEFQQRGDLAGLIQYLERGRTVYDGEVQPPKPWKSTGA
jgi:hypothetical protein